MSEKVRVNFVCIVMLGLTKVLIGLMSEEVSFVMFWNNYEIFNITFTLPTELYFHVYLLCFLISSWRNWIFCFIFYNFEMNLVFVTQHISFQTKFQKANIAFEGFHLFVDTFNVSSQVFMIKTCKFAQLTLEVFLLFVHHFDVDPKVTV